MICSGLIWSNFTISMRITMYVKNQTTNYLAKIFSNSGNKLSLNESRSLDIGYAMLCLKDKTTYAASFKLSSTRKNILADILEMSLIDLLPNNFHGFKNFVIFLCTCQSLRQNAHFLSRSKLQIINVQKDRLNELANFSINCEMD